MLIPEYFLDKELKCPDCGLLPKPDAIKKLYTLRLLYMKPIKITSAFRCAEYNKKIGGSKHSKHVLGTAFDCKVPKQDELKFITLAKLCGFNGIGVNDNKFTHIDTREKDAFWTYK